jgi:hypothetical protein
MTTLGYRRAEKVRERLRLMKKAGVVRKHAEKVTHRGIKYDLWITAEIRDPQHDYWVTWMIVLFRHARSVVCQNVPIDADVLFTDDIGHRYFLEFDNGMANAEVAEQLLKYADSDDDILRVCIDGAHTETSQRIAMQIFGHLPEDQRPKMWFTSKDEAMANPAGDIWRSMDSTKVTFVPLGVPPGAMPERDRASHPGGGDL